MKALMMKRRCDSKSLCGCTRLRLQLVLIVLIVLIWTSLGKDNNAHCRIYETTGSDTHGFRKRVSELDSSDKSFAAIGEFWAKDRQGVDVLVVTPWLRRGTAHWVYTR